jgi:hypothetical protein
MLLPLSYSDASLVVGRQTPSICLNDLFLLLYFYHDRLPCLKSVE